MAVMVLPTSGTKTQITDRNDVGWLFRALPMSYAIDHAQRCSTQGQRVELAEYCADNSNYSTLAESSGKRAGDPSESRWSPLPMDTRKSRRLCCQLLGRE
ncbi:hypothetical protein EVAR_89843_1 [Eumeta japonica]|uniref:Uncharacterized protein n=1 Tax=Eumeta variegata TaxID=151549 RepID=A0A4C1ZYF6_EUMVA|nr:hypothetical protein EVAR_89843_1 [Eumeta japonica]